jgi:uncharacterized protein (TIGR02246 family)
MLEAVEEKASVAIAAVNQQFMDGVAKGDAAQVAAVYATDGWALPPGGPIVKGREAVQGLWQGVIDSGVKGAVLETIDLDVHGDDAVEAGEGTLLVAGGQVAGRVKYIVVWKRINGEWKYYRDIWNELPA